MSKSLAKFCSISKYLEITDPKLYEVLDDLCMINFTKPRKFYNGVTFIIPSSADAKKIADMRFTDKIEEAQDILGCHVINDFLPSPAVWWQKKEDIPNANKKKVEVEKVSSDKVYLPDGVELELDKKFKSLGNKNQVVYRVVKGAIRPDPKARPATFALAKQGAPTKGGAPLILMGEFNKKDYMYKRISQFLGTITTRKIKVVNSDSATTIENPLMEDILSFNNWMTSNPDPVLTPLWYSIVYTPLSTFIALFMLDDFSKALNSWYDNGRYLVSTNPVDDYLAVFANNTLVPDASGRHDPDPKWAQHPAKLYGNDPLATTRFNIDFARFIEAKIFLPTQEECCMVKFKDIDNTAENALKAFMHDLKDAVAEIVKIFKGDSALSKQMVILSNFMKSDFACFNPTTAQATLKSVLGNYSIDTPADPVQYVTNLLQSLPSGIAKQVIDSFVAKNGGGSTQGGADPVDTFSP